MPASVNGRRGPARGPATYWLNSSGIVGALVLLVMSILALVRGIRDAGLDGITEPLVLGVVGSALAVALFVWRLVKPSSAPVTVLRGRAGCNLRMLVPLAFLGLVAAGCSGFTHAVINKVVRTASVGASVIDTWCDPVAFPTMDVEACEQAKMWSEVGAAGLALILPYFVEPEFGKANTPPPKTRLVVISCLRVEAGCKTAKHPEHLRLCVVAREGCAGDGALIAFEPSR